MLERAPRYREAISRLLCLLLVASAFLALAPIASAEVMPFGKLACVSQDGARRCDGSEATRIPTFDGEGLLDVNVALPPTGDANLPLIVMHHGYGGSKYSYGGLDSQIGRMRDYAARGYAVLSYSARGFAGSCGTPSSRLSGGPACARGWIHLDDARKEARDTQHLAGLLADQGIVDPQRIGVMGVSYGGILSFQLAALRDRMFDGDSLVPFVSPEKKLPMRIAAAAPSIPGSDLAYSLVPNGRTFDYVITKREDNIKPVGVVKASYVAGFYGTGQTTGGGYYAPPGIDPSADINSWFARLNAGEPYDNDPNVNPGATYIADQVSRFHSGYSIDDSVAPAPMFIANGWTDDLFPADEALRMYNRTRKRHPGVPLALLFHDFGHARGQNKAADAAVFAHQRARIAGWMDAYVRGGAEAPAQGVETRSQTCPREAPSGGPFVAPSWDAIHPGEVRFLAKAELSFNGEGSDPAVSRAVDPIAGQGACATTDGKDQPNTATYRLPKVVGGYTLMGSPTVIARMTKVDAQNAQVNARLWDVAPNGTQTLVARTVYRPIADGRPEPFQLHANGWRFADGHTPKLELLGADAPYARPSNGSFQVNVSDVALRLPVNERPDCTQVLSHAPPVLPAYNQELAPDVSATGTGECRDPEQRSAGRPGDFGTAGGRALSAAGAVAASGCTVAAGFRSPGVRPRGAGLRFVFSRRVRQPVQVEVFQASIRRNVIGPRLVASFKNRTRSFTWNGKANRRGRRVTDGHYFVRYRMTLPGRRPYVDTRRSAVQRRGGRFLRRPSFSAAGSCGVLRSVRLSRPVFGGRRNRALVTSYQLNRPAAVVVTVLRSGRVVRRFRSRNRDARRTYRVRFDARRRPRGDYVIRVSARSGATAVSRTVVARRL